MYKIIFIIILFCCLSHVNGNSTYNLLEFAENTEGKSIEWWKNQILEEPDEYDEDGPCWCAVQILKPYIIIAYKNSYGIFREDICKIAVKCGKDFWKKDYKTVNKNDPLPGGKYKVLGLGEFPKLDGFKSKIPVIKLFSDK